MKSPLRSLPLIAGLLFTSLAPSFAAPEKTDPPSAPLITGLTDLKALDQKLVSMADRAAAATVSLISTKGKGAGSAVIVSREGLILSAAHVLSALSGEIIVLFPDGRRAKAKALGADFDRDAAMLQILTPGEYPFVEIADPTPLLTNSWCVALGHPGGFDPLRTPPLRLGRVTHYLDFIITDCTVVSGDSGGPLFDTDGRLIGIHSNIGSGLSQNRHVPIKAFRDKWDDMLAGKSNGTRFNSKTHPNHPGEAEKTAPPKPALGLKLGKESPDGITIDEVLQDSRAAKAGLLAGDVIVRIAGKSVTTHKELTEALAQRKPRPKVPLAYRRDGHLKRIKIPFPAADHPKEGSDNATASKDELNNFIDKCLENAKNGKANLMLTPQQLEKFGGMEKFQERLKQRLASKMKNVPDIQVEDRTKPSTPATDAEKDELFAKLLELAKANGGPLQVSPEDVAKLGGIEELNKRLKSIPAVADSFFLSVMDALKDITQDASKSTVSVLADGKDVSLGTVISADGGILTKNSETTKGRITVQIGEKTYPATLIKRFPNWDLALFCIQADGLHPVSMNISASPLERGSLLTVPGPQSDPIGIGMVSVKSRPLGQMGFLGVQIDQTAMMENRVMAQMVQKDGPADKAGLKNGDVITSIAGHPTTNPIEFTRSITKFKPNDLVKFDVLRGEEKLTLEVKLGERPMPTMSGDFLKVNQMSGPLSPKTDGFPLALQHDIPLEPAQCGGPLLNLDGRCVGINIARAGRVKTLAIPAEKIAWLLKDSRDALAKTAKTTPAANDDEVTLEDIKEVTKALEDLEQKLKKFERRLKPATAN